MILSRLFYFMLRGAEFICAMVVLGINSFFIHEYRKHGHQGPIKREIYVEVVATVTAFFSLIWLLPFTANFMHYPLDLLYSAAWFAAFALQVNWIHKESCGGIFHWNGITHGGYCNQWKAAEAFSFISGILWFVSFALGFHIFHNLRKRNGTTTNTTTTTTRRRGFGRRHVV